MTYSEVQPIALAIMTSIITGGFVLVFVEIGNRKNRENERNDRIMNPFLHKLSAYFRFMGWCEWQIIYPNDINENEKEFKTLVNQMALEGNKLTMSGEDYGIDNFTAKQLDDIALKINNIWYYRDKMHPCRLGWKGRVSYDGIDLISKELKEINPSLLSEEHGVDLVAKVSGDFYVDVYQPIEYETFRHEAYIKQYNTQTVWVASFFSFVLLMLCLMLFVKLPVLLLQLASAVIVLMLVISLVTLAFDVKYWVGRRAKRIDRKRRRKENRARRINNH